MEEIRDNKNIEEQNQLDFLEKLIKENNNDPEKKEIALGLLKKALERNPFKKELHQLYLSVVKDNQELLIKFVNDLISAFSLTFDYKYYDLIIMTIANNVYYNNKNEKELFPLIENLHNIIKAFQDGRKQQLKTKIETLEGEKLELTSELKKTLEQNEEVIKAINKIKTENNELQSQINKIQSIKTSIEHELTERRKNFDSLLKEKDNLMQGKSELEKLLSSIQEEKNNLENNLNEKKQNIDLLTKEKDNLKEESNSLQTKFYEIKTEKDKLETDLNEKQQNISELQKEKDKIQLKNQLLQERIDSMSDVVANVVVKQETIFDKLSSKIQNVDKIQESLATGNIDDLINITNEISKKEINLDENTSSDSILKYVVALESLLKKINDQTKELKDENITLKDELIQVEQQKETKQPAEITQPLETKQPTEITQKVELNEDAYQRMYNEIYEKITTQAYSEIEEMKKKISRIEEDEGLIKNEDGSYSVDKSKVIEEMLAEISFLKEEIASRDELNKSYKEAIYDIFDENHELVKAYEDIEGLLNAYENGLVSIIKRRILNKKQDDIKTQPKKKTTSKTTKKPSSVRKTTSKNKKIVKKGK